MNVANAIDTQICLFVPSIVLFILGRTAQRSCTVLCTAVKLICIVQHSLFHSRNHS